MAANENRIGSNTEALVGSLVDGRYLIQEELGAGGMGAVYIARDLKVHGRNVVIKVLLEESFQHEYVVKKFRQEAEALSRVEHPNVVKILDFGEMANNQPYLVLQYIEGVNLRAALGSDGIELGRAAQIVKQVAYALSAAHAKGILHRDLKPENIMLQPLADGEEQVIVIDFGIAKVEDSVIAPKTMIGTAAGTIAYMSPEQLSAGELTPASDTYALAVIAYELVTGRKPFNPKSPFQLLEMQRTGVEVMPRDLRPELPEETEREILKALLFNAGERHARTRDFGGEFCRTLTGVAGGTFVCTDDAAAQTSRAVGGATGITPAAATQREAQHATAIPTQRYATEPLPTDESQPAMFDEAEATPPPSAAHEAQPIEPTTTGGRQSFLIPAIALVLVVIAGGVGFAVWRSSSSQPTAVEQVAPNTATAVAPANTQPATLAAPEISLNYSLTVQRMRDGKEYKEPFQSTGREIFENGWRFRMNVAAPQPGYLYLINEGLNASGATAYTVLFPTSNSAALIANQQAQIPAAPQYYYFTGEAGTEKIWMVWAAQPIAELEAVKSVVNEREQGEVSDPAQIASVRDFLAKRSSSSTPEVVRDAVKKETTVKVQSEMLVHLAQLEHQ